MKISLIIPCYNEETNLQKGVLDKIGNFTQNDSRFAEVLIVDDGSTDKSLDIINRRYVKNFPKIKLIKNPHQGKAYAVITGIKKAQGDHVAFSDIDLATPLEELEKLIKEVPSGFPIIIGSRSSQRRGAPILRKIMALGGMIIRNFIIGIKGVKDTQCGFKLFKKSAALDIIKRLQVFGNQKEVVGSSVSAAFDMEFLFLATKLKYRIKEVPVIWKHVETKNVNFIKDSIETLRDIFRIKYLDLTGAYKKK